MKISLAQFSCRPMCPLALVITSISPPGNSETSQMALNAHICATEWYRRSPLATTGAQIPGWHVDTLSECPNALCKQVQVCASALASRTKIPVFTRNLSQLCFVWENILQHNCVTNGKPSSTGYMAGLRAQEPHAVLAAHWQRLEKCCWSESCP